MTNLVQQRHHKAEKVAWLLQIVPFIRLIGLTGSLAYDVAQENSDIDLLIIAKQDRIWTSRFFTVILLKFFRLYRTGNSPRQRAGKICTNRFLADKYLLINPQNRYHAQDYSQMIPLYYKGNIYKKFLAKNEWMEKYGYFPPKRVIGIIESAGWLSTVRKISEWILLGFIGDWLEMQLKKFQLKKIMKNLRVNKPDYGIYVDDNELRFHPRPR